MVADPTERYQPERYEAEKPATFEHPARLSLGEGAVRAALRDTEPEGMTLYEASYYPGHVAPEQLIAAIDHTAGYAVEKSLLAPEEAEWLRCRLQGFAAPELSEEHASGRSSTQSHLLGLVRDHPGDMNNEGPERRRRAMAMKGLLQKFLGDPHPRRRIAPMDISEIESWVAGISDRNNMFGNVTPDDVLPMLAGGFDAVFRRAPRPPLAR